MTEQQIGAFETRTHDIDWRLSVMLAEASQIAYQNEREIVSWATSNLYSINVEFVHAEDTEVFIAENDSEMYIVFRGSKGFRDWLANMKALKFNTDYGKIHSGFMDGFSVVRGEIFTAMNRARDNNKKLYLSGHSLGGALAAIAAADSNFHIGSTPIEGIYTYGMPKTSNRTAANYINSNFGTRFFRFVNDRDIVTRIPPGSRHVGRLIHFDKHGEIKNTHNNAETTLASDENEDDITEEQFKLIQKGLKRKKGAVTEGEMIGADDHSIGKYIDILTQHRNNSQG